MSRLITASGHPVTANMPVARKTLPGLAVIWDITSQGLVLPCKRRTSVVLMIILIMTNASAAAIW